MLEKPADLPAPGVHPWAVVSPQAKVDPSAAVGPFVVIGAKALIGPRAVLAAHVVVEAEAAIGEETILYPGTVIMTRSRIGRRCRIGPNAVIGSAGFGYFFHQGRHKPFPHVGVVEIGDDVDIGACSCVDRAKFDVTRIGSGVKIDNLVQVAHNVQVGENCILVAQVGIGGSSVLGEGVVLGGHVGVRDNVTIGRGVQASGFAGIVQDVPDGQKIGGCPGVEARQWLRVHQASQSLPELRQKVRELEHRLEKMEPKKQ
jgi:UDP-3-O-[3-hydroxymyristoyl] glucosamine N-acyltransferase